MLFYYFLYFIIFIYLLKMEKRALHMLQQNLYNENNRYLKWIKNNSHNTLIKFDIYGILFSMLIFIIVDSRIKSVCFIILIVLYIFSYLNEKRISSTNQNKKPLVYTKRIKRLIVTLSIIYLSLIIIPIVDNDLKDLFLFILTILTTLNFFVTYLAVIINSPIEKMIYKHYEKMAKNKLHSMKNLKVVGITGSYGKTSCKNILNDILNVKFNSLATEKSLNTFNGLMITVNNKLSKFDEVFIAEMGAYVKGEINGLCDLVEPKYGIITTIGTAHLETFGSEQNIIDGKMELIEHLPSDGVGVLNKDDPKQVGYKIKNNCKILWIGIENKDVDVYACNIKSTSSGTVFDVVFKGDKKKYKFETKLLGYHNVYNILSGLALGYEFGLKVEDLQKGVRKVQTIEHRLEIKNFGYFYQIDDAYNSNPIGAKRALEILDMMDGEKIVVTPGMVELGEKEYELNKEFGKQISDVADKVILIGEKKTKPIYEGLIEKKYKKENIYVLNDVKESYSLIKTFKSKKDIFALYENDLPDTYNE